MSERPMNSDELQMKVAKAIAEVSKRETETFGMFDRRRADAAISIVLYAADTVIEDLYDRRDDEFRGDLSKPLPDDMRQLLGIEEAGYAVRMLLKKGSES